MAISKLTGFIKTQAPTYVTIYGGMTKKNEFVRAFVDEAHNFLQENRGKYLSSEEVAGFFKTLFPGLKLKVFGRAKGIDKEVKYLQKRCMGNASKEDVKKVLADEKDSLGALEVMFDYRTKRVTGFEMQLPDVKPAGFLRKLFGMKKPNEGKFLVNTDFADTLTHEGVHLVQALIKPTSPAYKRMMLKYTNNSINTARMLEDLCEDVYYKNVYCQNLWDINPKEFTDKLLKELGVNVYPKRRMQMRDSHGHFYRFLVDSSKLLGDEKLSKHEKKMIMEHCPPFFSSRKVVINQLKLMLRSLYDEKQAYEAGDRMRYSFKSPRLDKIKFMRDIFQHKTETGIETAFRLKSKIDALRETFTNMVNQERNTMLTK